MSARVMLGVVGRPHGVRGLVRVQSYTADPRSLAEYGPLLDDEGRRWSVRWRGDGVAELRDADGVPLADRTAAERLTNLRLYIERDRLPASEDEDEFYLADLIGLQAVHVSGEPLGRIAAVHDYGAGASLDIEQPGRPSLLIPFTRACAPHVDLAAGRVTVAPPDEVIVAEDAPEAAQEAAHEAGTAAANEPAAEARGA